jgi:hypothetical protein
VITVEVVFTEEFVFCQVSFVRVQLLGLLVLPVDLMPVDLFSGYCFRWPPPSQAFWLGFVRVHCQQSVDPDLAGGSQRLPARDEWHRINFPSALFLPARFFFFVGCRPVSILLRPQVLFFSSLLFVGIFLELVSSAWLSTATFVGFLPSLCICFPQQHC